MFEVAADNIGTTLGAAQVRADVALQFRRVPGAPPADGVGLHVVVQILIRVQLGTVAGEEEERNPVRVVRHPARHGSGHMHGMPVHNEKHLRAALAHKPSKKPQKDLRGETLPEDHEAHVAAVGDCRDQIAAEPLARGRNDRRQALPAIRGARLMVGPHPHLVAPVDFGPLRLCLTPNRRVGLRQSARHGRRVPLVRPPDGLLRREPPTPQIPPHRPDGYVDIKAFRNQVSHRFARPQHERQLELLGTTIGDQTLEILGAVFKIPVKLVDGTLEPVSFGFS